jgi:hypothetical protein
VKDRTYSSARRERAAIGGAAAGVFGLIARVAASESQGISGKFTLITKIGKIVFRAEENVACDYNYFEHNMLQSYSQLIDHDCPNAAVRKLR